MVYERFYGSNSDSHEPFWGWRCIGCGEIVDEVILENCQYQNQEWRRRKGIGNRREDVREEQAWNRIETYAKKVGETQKEWNR